MNDITYTFGVVDEDQSDRGDFHRDFDDEFDIIEIPLFPEVEEIVDFIISNEIDAVAIDYLLTENDSQVTYNGNKIFEALRKAVPDFPCFIYTNNISAVEEVIIDQFRIINKDLEDEDRESLIHKVKNEIRNYKANLAENENRLLALIQKEKEEGVTISEQQEMNELNEYLIYTPSKDFIPKDWKRPDGLQTLHALLEKTDSLIDKLSDADEAN